MIDEHKLICDRCSVELTPHRTEFSYLGNKIEHDIPTCPLCGQVYVSRELTTGKIREVEELLEDK